MKPSQYLIIIFLLLQGQLQAQEKDSSNKKFRFDITGGFYNQKSLAGEERSKEIRQPDYLSGRRPQEPELANLWGLKNNNQVTDNPMGHGASYLRFHSWYNVTEGLDIYGSLEVNNAGFSWGPYNTFDIVALPRYSATYKKLFGKENRFLFNTKIGYFEDYKNYEGLTMYNLDVQGLQADIQYRKLKFSIMTIGDLIGTVGLNIDGLTDYQVSLNDIAIHNKWKGELKAGVQVLKGISDTGEPFDFATVSAALYNGAARLYTAAGYRSSDNNFSTGLNMAFLAGITNSHVFNRFSMDYGIEYRYYGGGFNYGFHNETRTHYRKTDRSAGSNFIGDQVYLISYYNRPFSQWAVFTEYDKKWVKGLTINLRPAVRLGRSLQLFGETDFNLIAAEGEENFWYPFFKTGIKFETIKKTYMAASITNKAINMDKHYPTYYLLKHPVFQFELRRDIKL